MEKIELMCFSTARSDSTSVAAMAALDLPCAISPRTSRSRGVRRSSGAGLRWTSGDELLDDLRVDHRAAGGDLADGVDEVVDVGDRSFSR